MLLVTLGRLSYAEPPQTLTTKLQNQLDQTLGVCVCGHHLVGI